jgi:hypothetical protein
VRRWFPLHKRDALMVSEPQPAGNQQLPSTASRVDAPGVAEVVLEEIVLSERGRLVLGLSAFTSYDAALWKRLASD